MSMNNVFHPKIRKWISPIYNIGEMSALLRRKEDVFMAPINGLPDCRNIYKANREESRKKEEESLKAVKAKLFGPKIRGKKKSKQDESDEDTTGEDDLELDDLTDTTESSEEDGVDTYWDEEDETDEEEMKRKIQTNEDLYMFDYTAVSSDEDHDQADQPEPDSQVPIAVKLDPEADVTLPEAVATSMETDLPEASMVPPEVPLPPDTAEQDKKEFKNYYEYVERHAAKVAQRNMNRTREEVILLIMSEQAISREEAEAQYEEYSELTSPQLAFSKSEVIVEDPIVKGSVMPVLAGPIPNEVLQAQGTLAVYAGLSDEPGNFQWRMGHVVDILSAQVKGNLRLLREENLEPPEAKKRDFAPAESIVTVSIYQPVEELDDILVEMRTIPEPEFGFEVELLSTQTVHDLCETFACQADLVYTAQFHDPDTLPAKNSEAIKEFGDRLSKNVYPWRAIFIHDTIYVNFDLDENNESAMFPGLKRIDEWAKRHKIDHGIGEIKFSSKMETKLSELNVQLGYPYVYIHQSTNCEHLWCFTSVRLPRRVEHSVFPRYKLLGKFPTKYCVIDNEVLARWAVVDCPRLPQNPMYLCGDCVKDYCFSTKTKESIGDFKLYPFFQLIHNI